MTQTNTNDDILNRCRAVPIHRLVGNAKVNRKVKILCPFHPENTASCNLFPTGGFKCYGCGKYGNTVDFVMALSDKPNEAEQFKEALEELKKYI